MKESVYSVKLQSKEFQEVAPVTFSEIGIKECADLQQWVAAYPRILGEDLLVLGTEFSEFSNSARRVDLLALDKLGVLVIVELKLEMERTHAELQAIRYAAMCSTMTMDDAVKTLVRGGNMDRGEAIEKILGFLEAEELPELSNQPRIILAASSFDDQELTSTVLWLRSFNVDITCVELLPYKMPSEELVLAPRTIIPLPETKSYQVKVERKESRRASRSMETSEHDVYLQKIKEVFCKIAPEDKSFILDAAIVNFNKTTLTVKPDLDLPLVYRWWIRPQSILIEIRFMWQGERRELNKACIAIVKEYIELCSGSSDFLLQFDDKGKETSAFCELARPEGTIDESHLNQAAQAMKFLREKTACLHTRFQEVAKG